MKLVIMNSCVEPPVRKSQFSATEQGLLDALHVLVSSNEYRRIQALRDAHILDSDTTEEKFQRLTSMAARIFKTPIAIVSLVDLNRLWFKSKVGFPTCEIIRDHTLCNYVVVDDAPPVFVVPDAKIVEEYNLNPFIHGPPYIRFYAAAPIYSNGEKIGTFCLIDSEPHYDFDTDKQKCLEDFAYFATELIEIHRVEVDEVERDLPRLSSTLLQNLRNPLTSVNHQFQLLGNQLGNGLYLCSSLRPQSKQVEEMQLIMSNFCDAVDQLHSALEVSLKLGITLTYNASEIARNDNISPNSLMDKRQGMSLHCYMMELKRATSLATFLGRSLHWSLQYDNSVSSAVILEIVPQRELEVLATLINFLSLRFLAPTNIDDNCVSGNKYHQRVHLSCYPIGLHLGELSVELSFPIPKECSPVNNRKSPAKRKYSCCKETSREEYDLSFLEEVLQLVRGHLIIDDSCYHHDTTQGHVLMQHMKLVVPCYLLSYSFPASDDEVGSSAYDSRPSSSTSVSANSEE